MSTSIDSGAHTELAIIKSGLDSLVREMAINLRRSAFSSIVRESRDFAVALLDRDGEVVAQAECIPIMTAGIALAFNGARDVVDMSSLRPDDAVLMNDPFNGGQHLQDIYLFTPIFVDDALVGFGASTAHHVDIGGAYPGLSAQATEIFQEGLRFPATRFSVTRDYLPADGFVRRIIEGNVRVPDAVIGDLDAQFAAAKTADRRLRELIERHGAGACLRVMDELKDYSELRTREAIRRLPDGVYTARETFEGASWGVAEVAVCVSVRIADDEIEVDFDGTSEQLRGNTNCPFASTVSAVQSAIRCVIDEKDIDFNEGCNRPLRVTAPFGSVLNPRPPAAVRSRLTPASRVFNAVVRSLSDAVPGAAVATGYDTSTVIAISKQRASGGYDVVVELIGGGWGACADHDGAHGMDNPISNCANAPVEALETDYDYFAVDEYSMVDESAGVGATSGGMGVRRIYRALTDDVLIAGYSDRHAVGARGLLGGRDGAPGSFVIERADGAEERLQTVYDATLHRGDRLVIVTGGGGGFGTDSDTSVPTTSQGEAHGKTDR
jgi:N-methylhydantoinase B